MYERSSTLVQKKFNEHLFPTILTSFAVSMASVVDSAIVGNLLGADALAAVGISAPIIFCINTIYMLFAIGGISCASIARGQLETRKSNQIFTLTMVVGLSVMFLFTIAVVAFISPISNLLASGDQDLAKLCGEYLKPLSFTAPALLFSSGLALFIRADGNPKGSARIVIIANTVNLILDYTLIKFFDFGITGAGLSTTIGYVMGGLVVVPYLLSKNRTFKFTAIKKGELGILLNMITTGTPKALTQLTSFLRSILLNAIVLASLGSIGMSVMTVCINVLSISNIFVGGTSDTLLPIIGTLFGEKDNFGIRKTINRAKKVLMIACTALVIFFIAMPETVGSWFGLSGEEELGAVVPALRMFALYLPFQAFNTLLQNFYNITNRKNLASSIAVMDGLIFVTLFAFVLAKIEPNIIWLCYVCSGLSTTLVILIIGMIVSKKEKVCKLLLLNEEEKDGIILDMSIEATVENASDLSQKIVDFSKENGIDEISASRIGVAMEEMVVNVSILANRKKKNLPIVDIFLRITDDETIIRFRDNGPIFDSYEYDGSKNLEGENKGTPSEFDGKITGEENLTTDGILLMKKLASKVEYVNQVGFNVTIFTLDR